MKVSTFAIDTFFSHVLQVLLPYLAVDSSLQSIHLLRTTTLMNKLIKNICLILHLTLLGFEI